MKFLSEETNQQFYNDGFCRINLLGHEEIRDLMAFAEETIHISELQNTSYGMYVSMEEVHDRRRKIKEYIQELVTPKITDHLINYKVHLAGFLIKVHDGTTYTYPHQDWTFVDNESDHVSATIWIALSDFDEQNGTLGFVKGSHKFLDFTIGSPSPIVKTPAMGKHQAILDFMKYEPVTAGEALVFDNKTIHGALPNNGDFPRIAVGIGVIPEDAQLHHYYLNPKNANELLKMRITDDFFLTYSNHDLMKCYERGELPGFSEVIGKIENYFKGYPSEEEIVENCHRFGNVKREAQALYQSLNEGNTSQDLVDEGIVDGRTFREKYTLVNIFNETRIRLQNMLGHSKT
ncbi:MAG: phytanoyl-CoA dioxygenase family protein [Cyclobacteriaceae bacterium]